MPRQFRSDDTSAWGEKFGTGKDGSITVSSNATFQVASSPFGTNANAFGTFSGTSGNSSGSVTDAYGFWTDYTFVNDYVLIHQTYGSGAGNWELNVVTGGIPAGAGSSTLTLKYPLQNTYSTGCQIIKCPQFTNFTLNNGVSLSPSVWDNTKFGIMAFFVNGTATINGSLSSFARGFLGGVSDYYNGYQGDSSTSLNNQAIVTRNGAGGGGGYYGNGRKAGGGGGGGNGTAGGAGQPGDSGSAEGGSTDGNAGLTLFTFGGGGGSGGWRSSSGVTVGSGGKGGGGIFIFARNLVVNGSIVASGETGGIRSSGSATSGQGGGGAGGSILIKSEVATLGSSLVTANGGAGGYQGINNDGGPGGEGRIHIDYALSYTGTTSPTIDARQDSTLGSAGGSFLLNLI